MPGNCGVGCGHNNSELDSQADRTIDNPMIVTLGNGGDSLKSLQKMGSQAFIDEPKQFQQNYATFSMNTQEKNFEKQDPAPEVI